MSIYDDKSHSLTEYGFTNPVKRRRNEYMTYEKAFDERFEEVGAMWDNDKGFSLIVNKEKYVVFKNKFATPENKQPTHRVYKAKEE